MNIVVSSLKRTKRPGSVRVKQMRKADGTQARVLSLDANSATFIDDITTVFERNVAKARRENKRLLGSADGRPKKS